MLFKFTLFSGRKCQLTWQANVFSSTRAKAALHLASRILQDECVLCQEADWQVQRAVEIAAVSIKEHSEQLTINEIIQRYSYS